ncbi:MAG TPA: MerR family transcriptional regulator [Candidatus Angelobacter sp.]|jgi:predicted DNA-binding transcriptional regulator AlpA
MSLYSTHQAAKKLGIGMSSLRRYIADGKVPAPKATKIGRNEVRAWTDEDIERVREILPKIENGRKTRYQKQRKAQTKRKSKQ